MAQECLNCRHYQLRPPPDWKPPYSGAEFDLWALRKVLGYDPQWNSGWPGLCRLQPAPIEVKSVHWCGQWQVNEEFLHSWVGLVELNAALVEIASLKTELKATKQLSLERYHRLQKPKSRKTVKRVAEPPGLAERS